LPGPGSDRPLPAALASPASGVATPFAEFRWQPHGHCFSKT
jgi:hypothetical protein